MSFFLVFLAVLLVGAVLWVSVGGRAGKQGGRRLPALLDGGFEEPPANLPPVLLPADAAPRDVDSIRFSLGLRGYRMDQVDQVLDELRDQLAAARHEVEVLTARLVSLEQQAAATEPEAQVALQGEPSQGEPRPEARVPGTAGAGAGESGTREGQA